jgi:hypothetical protein
MTQAQMTELKSIADKLALLGPNPKSDNQPKAASRLVLMERFERLIREATQADRRAIFATLKEMLEACK